jgi:hypothetical protein
VQPEDVIAGIGPVTSSWKLNLWWLLLGRTQLLACPYDSRETWCWSLAMETGFVRAPSVPTVDRGDLQKTLLRPETRTYRLSEIQCITLRNRVFRNAIEIGRSDGSTDRYGIMDREQTDHYRKALGTAYPTRYLEAGFPQSIWGRILKW